MKLSNITIDYSLYLVTDRELSLGRSHEEIVAAALKGGVGCVQLREKKLGTRKFIDQARILKKVANHAGVPFIINDRVDVALAVDADGVHLGQGDMALEDARRLLGADKIIGISVENLGDAITAEQGGADYLGISPVYATATKPDTATPLGLEGIGVIRGSVNLPLVGIGGINSENAGDVIRAGADGIAVVSAIVSSPSPEQAARLLLDQIHQAGKRQ